MDIHKYKAYLADNYEESIFASIHNKVTSKMEYDASNNFVFVRIPRQVAFKCKQIMRKEWLIVRYQIFKNLQAGRMDCCP